MLRFFKPVVVFGLLLLSAVSFASGTYLVCGSDEDGCDIDHPNSGCICVAYNDQAANQSYCVHFGLTHVTCNPRPANQAQCPKGDYAAPNQASCLALAFQSVDTPPCYRFDHRGRPITAKVCDQHHIVKCKANGVC